jgi:hypothetical protein
MTQTIIYCFYFKRSFPDLICVSLELFYISVDDAPLCVETQIIEKKIYGIILSEFGKYLSVLISFCPTRSLVEKLCRKNNLIFL